MKDRFMKKLLFILVLISIGFGLGFFYRGIKAKILVKQNQSQSLKTVYATHPILKNRPFVFVLVANNNGITCERTLLSILNQDYDNFRLIYIDDGSNDGSYEKVQAFLENHYMGEKAELFHNNEHQGTIESIYRAIHSCKSNEIIVILEGDEFLAHENVLNRLNHYYANPDVWVTEAISMGYPSYEKQEMVPKLRSFYVGLFQRIKLQDFLQSGEFLSGSPDDICKVPLRELSNEHAFFTPDILYISGIPPSPIQEEAVERIAYAPLKDIPTHDFIQYDEHADIVVFSYNRPLQLYAFLESAQANIQNLHRLYVIYHAENEHYEEGYDKVKKEFPHAIYIKQLLEPPYEDFAPLVLKTAFDNQLSTARYIAFAIDDNIIRDTIDMKEAVRLMKQTGAYGFYFRLGNHVNECPEKAISIQDNVFAWQFSTGEGEWACPNSVNMTLFKKEEIYPYFLCMKFHNPNILQVLWNEHADLSQVGLYYDRSKVVNLPLNVMKASERINEKMASISTKDLLTFFDQGLKMDIEPLNEIENCRVEIDYEPQFIRR
jgi:glycosyltransferase involved in cell wall biosynthesis